jgi:putative restriction endonuclease
MAFDYLGSLSRKHGDVIPFRPLSDGFDFDGIRVPLLGPQGIFKPKVLNLPLTITTAPNGPYDDAFAENGLLLYRYRGSDPHHMDNRGLRELMLQRTPLIYLHGVFKGKYLAAWPVYIVADEPGKLTFTVAVDDMHSQLFGTDNDLADSAIAIRRQYITASTRIRLHQRTFRERVLHAYRHACALCDLKHVSLLEAAHIIPDADERGEPLVSNGLSMCKIHHAAFDQNILGVRPDGVAEVREDILLEHDGPMLKHGLQEMHGRKLFVPIKIIDRPSKEGLEERYERFRAA